jgi:uncharacterized LabA/DUF88 family protein
MEHGNRGRNLALYIDFDNIAIGFRDGRGKLFEIRRVLNRLLEKGRIITKRAYADWKHYPRYKDELHAHGIELIEIPKRSMTGKNSADIRLVVDAMDLCHTNAHIDTFVIVSGDSDFSPLVSKLRENNKLIIGVGLRDSSSNLLVENCDEFIFYEDIEKEEESSSQSLGKKTIPKEKLPAMKQLVSTINALIREDTEVLYASLVKDTIKRKNPSFSENSLGYANFGEFLEEAQKLGVLEVTRDKERGGTWVVTKLKGLSR